MEATHRDRADLEAFRQCPSEDYATLAKRRAADPRAALEALIATAQQNDPALTNLEAYSLVLTTPRGQELYRQINDSTELLAALPALPYGSSLSKGATKMTETITFSSSEFDALAAERDPTKKRTLAERIHEKIRKVVTGETVAICKSADAVGIPIAMADVVATAAANGSTLADAAWLLIQERAEPLRKSAPGASPTRAQAITKYLDTPDGRRLNAAYHCADSARTAAEYLAVQKRRERLCAVGSPDGTWGGTVNALAKGYAAAHGCNYLEALDHVRREVPGVVDEYERERRGL
jgi:hypothetical protein